MKIDLLRNFQNLIARRPQADVAISQYNNLFIETDRSRDCPGLDGRAHAEPHGCA